MVACRAISSSLTKSDAGTPTAKVAILVATDVVSRGIDIDSIELVVNYDVPPNEEVMCIELVERPVQTKSASRDAGRRVDLEKLKSSSKKKCPSSRCLPRLVQHRPTTPSLPGRADGAGIEVLLVAMGEDVVTAEVQEEGAAKVVREVEKTSVEKASQAADVAEAREVNPKGHEFDARRVEGKAL